MERVVPREKWLYDDRGMMKWMGWLLSDHSTFLEKQNRKRQDYLVQSPMDLSEVNQNLQTAFETLKVITIQMDILNHDQYVSPVEGVIVGYSNGQIYLQQKNGQTILLNVDQIRSVSLVTTDKWWLDDYTV